MSRKSRDNTVSGVDALTPKQLQAIDLLASGYTVTDAAKEIGMGRETVSRWLSQNPFFMTVLTERQAQLWDASADLLRANVLKAGERLSKLIAHEDPHVALKAISVLFRASDIYPKHGRAHRKSANTIAREMSFADY